MTQQRNNPPLPMLAPVRRRSAISASASSDVRRLYRRP